MARGPRVVLPNVVHHVVSRGNDKMAIFRNGHEKELYLRRFSLVAAEEKVWVQGYCIMDNHVHWLLTPTTANGLARLFRRVHTWWAMTFNRKHGRTGHLMQGRFHSSPLSEDHYWTALRYVELNPQRARLVRQAEDCLLIRPSPLGRRARSLRGDSTDRDPSALLAPRVARVHARVQPRSRPTVAKGPPVFTALWQQRLDSWPGTTVSA